MRLLQERPVAVFKHLLTLVIVLILSLAAMLWFTFGADWFGMDPRWGTLIGFLIAATPGWCCATFATVELRAYLHWFDLVYWAGNFAILVGVVAYYLLHSTQVAVAVGSVAALFDAAVIGVSFLIVRHLRPTTPQ